MPDLVPRGVDSAYGQLIDRDRHIPHLTSGSRLPPILLTGAGSLPGLSRPGRGAGIAPGPFPRTARRARRAPLNSTGSPRFLPSGVVEDPGAGDRVAAVAVPGNWHRVQVEQLDPVRGDVNGLEVGQGHRRSSNGRLALAAADGHDHAGVFFDPGPV